VERLVYARALRRIRDTRLPTLAPMTRGVTAESPRLAKAIAAGGCLCPGGSPRSSWHIPASSWWSSAARPCRQGPLQACLLWDERENEW